MIRAGRNRHRVEIQEATETLDTQGSPTLTWAMAKKRWASIKPLSGNELVNAQQIAAHVSHEVRMRWTSGVTPKDRIVYGTRVFNIASVLNVDERDREMILMCTEVL